MVKSILGGLVAAALTAVVALPATAADDLDAYRSGDAYTGFVTATDETREMQQDDFMNPGMLWVEKGMELWETADGSVGKSCQDCHGSIEDMKGVATRYPTTHEESGKFFNIETRINECREQLMGAKPWKYESDELLGMTAAVKMQSRGMPMNVDITGANAEWFEKGKEFYHTRRGQMKLACEDCHIKNEGMMMRAELISQGQSNGFPTYRLKWQKLGSLHRRFRGCNNNIRAAKLPYGSDEYLAVELYVAHRGQGLPVESPSVRK